MPLMAGVMAVEHVTMWTALGEVATGRNTGWTKWQRLGVDGHAPTLAANLINFSTAATSVARPASIVDQLAALIVSDAEFKMRIDAELDGLLSSEMGHPLVAVGP